MKSNIMPLSNIYHVEHSLTSDKTFGTKVRGKSAIVQMLNLWSGSGSTNRGFHVDQVRHLLTEQQMQDFETATNCIRLEDKDESVYGFVRVGARLKSTCRCYNYSCKHFKQCRPGVGEEEAKESIAYVRALVMSQNEQFDGTIDNEHPPMPNSTIRELVDNDDTEGYVVTFEETRSSFGGNATSGDEFSTHGPDQEQLTVIEGSPGDKLLVNAGPGTGKTYSLIGKIKFMATNFDISPAENMLVLCFTNTAVKEIKARFHHAIESEELPDNLNYLEIRTFDSFATRLLSHVAEDLTGKGYEQRIEMAIDAITLQPTILADLQHIFVDEIQDLVGVRARFVRTIIEHSAGGFTLLGDALQGIYDYQIRDQVGELDSVGFRRWLEETTPTLRIINLFVNKRQSTALSEFSTRARKLLESGEDKSIEDLFTQVEDLRLMGSISDFTLATNAGLKTGILCRTNGEVLKLSGYLSQRGINHSVKRQSMVSRLPTWICTLLSMQEDLITEEEFNQIVGEMHIEVPQGIFVTLRNLGKGRSSFLSLHELRRNLAGGTVLPDDLYSDMEAPILVTTIHQSKGREFDHAYVLKSRLHGQPSGQDKFGEAKVYYVAITRAKSSLFTIDPDDYWMKKLNGTNRFAQTNRFGPARISRIEIGIDGDVDENSFVSGGLLPDPIENQEYVKSQVKKGDAISLRNVHNVFVIVHEERVIGALSHRFAEELRKGLLEVQEFYKRHPLGIDGLCVDAVYTIVKKPETLPEDVVEPYLKSGVWLGVHVTGMGRIVW